MHMEIIQAPLPRMPNVCAVTGRDDGDVVDFHVEVSAVDPHLYLRTTVIEEAAKLIGMVPAAKADELEAAIHKLADDLVETQRLLDAYRKVAEGEAALAEVFATSGDTTDTDPVPVPA